MVNSAPTHVPATFPAKPQTISVSVTRDGFVVRQGSSLLRSQHRVSQSTDYFPPVLESLISALRIIPGTVTEFLSLDSSVPLPLLSIEVPSIRLANHLQDSNYKSETHPDLYFKIQALIEEIPARVSVVYARKPFAQSFFEQKSPTPTPSATREESVLDFFKAQTQQTHQPHQQEEGISRA